MSHPDAEASGCPARSSLATPLVCLGVFSALGFFAQDSRPFPGLSADLAPAAWGGDHVGRPVPEYATGDECLFCHRMDVGPSWSANRHHQTIRSVDAAPTALATLKKSPALQALADDVKLVLGGKRQTRFLKPAAAHGRLELLALDQPHWDPQKFGDACAGCHATGVDAKSRAFSAASLDCFVCHGDVNPLHTKDTSLVHLAKKRQDPPRVVASICGQCHVRTGKSRSTGLPYPNNFVAGDNLFRDFQVEFAPEALAKLNPADRHVLANVQDIVVRGQEELTCLSCHEVHQQSSKKHHRLVHRDYCLHCHHATGPKKALKPFEVHSATCGY